MNTARSSYFTLVAASLMGTAMFMAVPAAAQPAMQIKPTSIGGVVTGDRGPEAGVWVIAETRDLPTRYIKIVATDDQGRYMIPDLPRELRHLGSRLWPRRFAQAEIDGRQAGEPQSCHRPE